MAKDFRDLAAQTKASWDEETDRVYKAASTAFVAEMDERVELGKSLAAARRARGLTQPALSELTGIQQAEISRIERGLGNPTVTTLLRLSDALDQRLTLAPISTG